MADDDDEVSNLLDDWKEFQDEQADEEADDAVEGGDIEAGDVELDPDEMGLEGEAAELFDEAFEGMAPDNPEILDMDLDSAMVEAVEEEEDDSEDDAEGEDDEAEEEVCEGSTPMQLTPLGERGPVEVMMNYFAVDAIKEGTVLSSEPSEEQMERLAEVSPQLPKEIKVNDELNADEFRGSYSQGVEIHFDAEDADTVHNAIGTVMTPTDDKLARNPDAEITPEKLHESKSISCHDDFDHVRTFDIGRDGDAGTFIERGPWTVRRFNIQDLIDELSTRAPASEDGFLVVVHATPFK